MAHNFEAQRAETFATFAAFGDDAGLPAMAVVDFQFYAEDIEPDWDTVEKALGAAGFATTRDEADGALDASIGPITISPENIWHHERIATEIALQSDFQPDGWGLVDA